MRCIKFFWDFMIQTDHPTLAKIPGSVLINKKKELVIFFALPADHWLKIKESKKIYKYINLARELKDCQTWKTSC